MGQDDLLVRLARVRFRPLFGKHLMIVPCGPTTQMLRRVSDCDWALAYQYIVATGNYHGISLDTKSQTWFTIPKGMCGTITLGITSPKDSPPGGSVLSGSHVSGNPFVELSRASAMRMVTTVTRPTMVASSG
jgi:hypothetical protein